mgnify:CR=1 FL=1
MTPEVASKETERLCKLAPVIPVLDVDHVAHAVPLAKALIAGGLPVLEVTLRTPAALAVICEMSQIEGGYVGAGTLLSQTDVIAARKAGAIFGVSPGATDNLLDACEGENLPVLPGAATASEVMHLFACGYRVQKFFPAEVNGGVSALKAIGAPIPQVAFCPTGGISLLNASSYLRLSNTLCVGGSWVAPKQLIQEENWDAITGLAREASLLSAE